MVTVTLHCTGQKMVILARGNPTYLRFHFEVIRILPLNLDVS